MAEHFLDRLRQGPLLCDGAMGTVLYARASASQMHGRCFDELALTSPDLVQRIHREYILAGAQVIETNTFGANDIKLGAYGLGGEARRINRRAAQLAREAREVAGQAVFVAGAVGPSGQMQIPDLDDDEPRLAILRGVFREQIEALMEGGVELLILETFSSVIELRQAALAAREAGDLPVVAQLTFNDDGLTLAGETPEAAVRSLAGLGVVAIGSNCSQGPAGIEDAVQRMAATLRRIAPNSEDDVFLSAQPNAGLPQRVENRFLYGATPAYFADYARRFAESGVRLIGGCCGTTPAHIAAMRDALSDYQPQDGDRVWTVETALTESEPFPFESQLSASDEGTRFQRALSAGRFVVSIELDPPKGLNPSKILDGAAYLKSLGLEFINIADSPMARVRMSCIALARLLRDILDLEAILHMTARDRNIMALQSDVLGAHALGLHNVLALTGDPVHAGNYPNLTGVWDVDSVGLIRVLRGMNEGYDAGGAALGAPARFHVGAALDLNMRSDLIDVERERTRRKLLEGVSAGEGDGDGELLRLTETELELQRLRQKLDAGAQFIMTQPIYSLEPLERFHETFGPLPVPMVLGMIPLHSSKQAEYLHNEVPGFDIPDEVRARMREAGERAREVGIELAYEVITGARDRGLIQGCYLMPSFGRYDLVGDLAQELLRHEQETHEQETAAAD